MGRFNVTISIDPVIKERLSAVSKKSDIPMSRIIEQLLKENLPKLEDKHMIHPKLKL
ncbi:MAG: ribbon-helix-helix domain-containing protein [Thermodesulfovibrionales bacterium]